MKIPKTLLEMKEIYKFPLEDFKRVPNSNKTNGDLY